MIQFARVTVGYKGDNLQVVGEVLGEGHALGVAAVRHVRNVRMRDLGSDVTDAALVGTYLREMAADVERELARAWGYVTDPLF
jgi:hypothetical protein